MNTIKNTIHKITGRGDETSPVVEEEYNTHPKKETSDEAHEKAYGLGKHGPRHQPGDAQYYETGTGRVFAAAGQSPADLPAVDPAPTSDVGVPIIPNPTDKLDTGYGRTGYVAPDVGAIGSGPQGYTPGMGVMSDMGSTGHTAAGAPGMMSNIGSSGYTTSHTTNTYTGPMGATGFTDSTGYRGTTVSDSTPTGYEMGHNRPAHGPTATDKMKGAANKVTTAAREGIAKAKETYNSQP